MHDGIEVPPLAMATAAELGANQCAAVDSEMGRCAYPAGHGRVIEPSEGSAYDHAVPEKGAWWNDDAPEGDDETTEANEPGWTGGAVRAPGWPSMATQQCSSRCPEKGRRCVRELGHVGIHMRDAARWRTGETAVPSDGPADDPDAGRCRATQPGMLAQPRCVAMLGHPGAHTAPSGQAWLTCAAVSPHGDRCERVPRHRDYMDWPDESHRTGGDHSSSWVIEHNPEFATGPKLIRATDLPTEAQAMLSRILGVPCADDECPFHGATSTGPDFTEPGGDETEGQPRVRILPLPNSAHHAPRFILVVDREPASGEPVTREMWSRASVAMGAATLILDSRTIDLPQVDAPPSAVEQTFREVFPGYQLP